MFRGEVMQEMLSDYCARFTRPLKAMNETLRRNLLPPDVIRQRWRSLYPTELSFEDLSLRLNPKEIRRPWHKRRAKRRLDHSE